MVRNIPNRNTIEDFTEETDEAELVRQYTSHADENVISVFVSYEPFASSHAPFFQSGAQFAISFFPPDMLAMRTAGRKCEMEPLEVVWILCSFDYCEALAFP